MFFSSVHADDDLKRYPAAIQKAIEYAKNTDFSALEDGRQEIDGDKMYANLFHLTSKQKEEARASPAAKHTSRFPAERRRRAWCCSKTKTKSSR